MAAGFRGRPGRDLLRTHRRRALRDLRFQTPLACVNRGQQLVQLRVGLRRGVLAPLRAASAHMPGRLERRAHGGLVEPRLHEAWVLHRLLRRWPEAGAAGQQRPEPSRARLGRLRQPCARQVRRRGVPGADRRLHRRAGQRPRLVRPRPEEQRVGGDTQGPNVDLGTIGATLQHLWRHEGWRAVDPTQVLAVGAGDCGGEAEVAELQDEAGPWVADRRDEVVGLDIPVSDASRVARRNRREHLAEQRLKRRLGQAGQLLEQGAEVQITPLHQHVAQAPLGVGAEVPRNVLGHGELSHDLDLSV
mmetsp:Transcript_46565/g.134148  ORF Transcript_46565/g.134148 Transcript_46565/m.134148 type:complete len:303 (+) Transcript_46565:89-997(+)